ncbi:MAG: DUF4255 domain-containing protein [Deltaproteobacteria bacterium HGW-Deltaproteobacteria-15]|jgi:hypothetical protein|nr:MAG: DUF4255 domain-containing protein [Deltaproteobacteria bacterium HGW-Deltaproteobacteria-15]
MINTIIEHIASRLNEYFNVRAGAAQELWVVPGSLMNLDGTANNSLFKKVVLSVVNVEEDRIYHSTETFSRRPDGTSDIVKPEVRLNLYLIFIGNFGQYTEALKEISWVIAFFQHHPAFEYASIQGLEGRRGRIVFEMFSPTFEQQNHLWGALGAKYMPSVLYKAGLVTITDEAVEGEAPPVQAILIESVR